MLVSEWVEPWEGDKPGWLETGWHVAGAETTRRQIREAGLPVENERGVSDTPTDGER